MQNIAFEQKAKNCALTVAAIMFLLAAVVSLVVGIISFIGISAQVSDFVEVNAVITEITQGGNNSSDYQVLVSYSDPDGREYTSELGYYQSSMREGQTISLQVNPDNYGEINSSNPYVALIICSLLFVVFLICTIVMRKNNLPVNSRSWTPVEAVIIRWEVSAPVVLGRETHRAVCEAVDENGIKREYISSAIPITRDELANGVGEKVIVRVNPKNPDKYEVRFDDFSCAKSTDYKYTF